MNVSELERALFARFPREDAEPWDHVGLSVGDPDARVAGVAVALDATERTVRAAAAAGANVLVSHHPVYIKAPAAFAPAAADRPACSAAVYETARLGLSVMSFHTNLDRSLEARYRLSSLLDLDAVSSIEHPLDPAAHGLGALCGEVDSSLAEFVGRCAFAFGGQPRVWGDPAGPCGAIAILGGSLGEFGDLATRAGARTIVCGEAGYHVCQDLADRGRNVILLGHDRSEDPFADILMDVVIQAGVDAAAVHRISFPVQWWTAPTQEQERS